MTKKLSMVLSIMMTLHGVSYSQTFNKAKLDSFFAALNTPDKIMGSIAMSANGIVFYQNAIGCSVVNAIVKTQATTKTRYRIGSISKMFTATMIFQLIEEDKLTLKTSLATYFPQLPNASKITIGEMLGHRSGLHNFTNDSLYATYMGKPQSEPEMLAVFAKQKPDFEPDTKAEYSNTNFVVLGYIIEKITGKPYQEQLKKRITSKIGLADTYYGSKTNPQINEAYSYSYSNEHWIQMPETDMSIPGGAGAIVSTPTDLVKFIEAVFAGKLIQQADLEQMKTMKDNYGMGIRGIPFYEKTGYGHNGGIDGFSSTLAYFPEDKLAIAFTSNGATYSTNDVAIAALSAYFGKPFTIPNFRTVTLTEGDLKKYVGNYASSQMPLKIAITKNSTTLMAQATGQSAFPLEAKGSDKFVFTTAGVTMQFDPPKTSFTLNQGGATYLFTRKD